MANFESFSEDLIPRIVPQTAPQPVLDMSKPIVPEVSLIFDESTLNKDIQPTSYKEWRQQQLKQQQQKQKPLQQQHQYQSETVAKVLPNEMHSNDRKKIVTFDLPMNGRLNNKLPKQLSESTPAFCQQFDLSMRDPKNGGHNTQNPISSNHQTELPYNEAYNRFLHQNEQKLQLGMPVTNQLNTSNELSQQMPMQHTTKQLNYNSNQAYQKEIALNEIYQLLKNMQVNSQSKGQINQAPNNLHPFNAPIDSLAERFEPPSNAPYASNESTMRDLFNVILKQQEQLMMIQNQVHVLLRHTASTRINQLDDQTQYNNQTADTHTNANEIEHKKQVGVMTSLEINVQKNYKPNEIRADDNYNTPVSKRMSTKSSQMIKQCGCACNCELQKTSQPTDSGSNDENFDTMNSPNYGETQTGWTFYGNILNQVNDVLTTSPASNTNASEYSSPKIAAHIEKCYSNTNDIGGTRTNIIPKHIRTPTNVYTTRAAPVAAVSSTPTTPTLSDTSANRHTEIDRKNINSDMSITSYRYMEKYGLL